MENINNRFKKLRSACKKSQEEFGKILGLSRSGISEIESGRRNVTEQHLIMLKNWSEKSINIEWLRTGTGDMFIPLTRDEEISLYVGQLIKENDSFKKRLISSLLKLDSEQWKVLEHIANDIIKKGLRSNS